MMDANGFNECSLSKSEKKMLDYIASHKKPVKPKMLADRFFIHVVTAQAGLKKLHDCGLADRTYGKGGFFYVAKR